MELSGGNVTLFPTERLREGPRRHRLQGALGERSIIALPLATPEPLPALEDAYAEEMSDTEIFMLVHEPLKSLLVLIQEYGHHNLSTLLDRLCRTSKTLDEPEEKIYQQALELVGTFDKKLYSKALIASRIRATQNLRS